jgi:hypothetical protein
MGDPDTELVGKGKSSGKSARGKEVWKDKTEPQ